MLHKISVIRAFIVIWQMDVLVFNGPVLPWLSASCHLWLSVMKQVNTLACFNVNYLSVWIYLETITLQPELVFFFSLSGPCELTVFCRVTILGRQDLLAPSILLGTSGIRSYRGQLSASLLWWICPFYLSQPPTQLKARDLFCVCVCVYGVVCSFVSCKELTATLDS